MATVQLSLPSSLTAANAVEVLQQLRQQAGQNSVQLDAASLQQFDSAALALLLDLKRNLATGAQLQVTHVSARLQELAQLYGVGELLWPELAAPVAA